MQVHHRRYNRITIESKRNTHEPYIRDLRIPVAMILTYLGSGKCVDEILKDWPELEREDIYQALGYAATEMESQLISP